MKTYPGSDLQSDHVLLVANVKTRLTKTVKIVKKSKPDTQKIKITEVREEVTQTNQ